MFRKKINKTLISPSIFASDLLNLGREIKKINRTSCDMIHVDIMDGYFVPNVSLPLSVIDLLNKKSRKFLDVHLMVINPLEYIELIKGKFRKGMITVHVESENVVESLKMIKKLKFKTGITIKPSSDIKELFRFLHRNYKLVDNVLVMGVEPGFSGQKFKKDTIKRVKKLKDFITLLGKDISIEVDGGVNEENAVALKSVGANILVAGSSIFSEKNYSRAVKRLR